MLPHYLKVYEAFLAGKLEEAAAIQHKANNVMEALCKVGLIPAVKYLLRKQGNDCGMARAPFHNLTPEQQQYIDEVTEKNLIS